MKKCVAIIIFFIFIIPSTHASVWYDKLPESGEYVPVSEEKSLPLDFTQGFNAAPSPAQNTQNPPPGGNAETPNVGQASGQDKVTGQAQKIKESRERNYKLWFLGFCVSLLVTGLAHWILLNKKKP